MLKQLLLTATLTLPIASILASSVYASDIGGAPVKAIATPPTYSTVYSATYYATPFGYEVVPIFVTPIVPYNSLTVTSGNTRFELTTPAPYSTYNYGLPVGVYGYPQRSILSQPNIYIGPTAYPRNGQQACRSRGEHYRQGHARSCE